MKSVTLQRVLKTHYLSNFSFWFTCLLIGLRFAASWRKLGRFSRHYATSPERVGVTSKSSYALTLNNCTLTTPYQLTHQLIKAYACVRDNFVLRAHKFTLFVRVSICVSACVSPFSGKYFLATQDLPLVFVIPADTPPAVDRMRFHSLLRPRACKSRYIHVCACTSYVPF